MKQCVEADLLFLINFLYWNPNPQHLRMWHGIGSILWLLPKGEKKSKTCSIHFPWGFWGHRRDLHHNIKWIYQVEFIHFLLKRTPIPSLPQEIIPHQFHHLYLPCLRPSSWLLCSPFFSLSSFSFITWSSTLPLFFYLSSSVLWVSSSSPHSLLRDSPKQIVYSWRRILMLAIHIIFYSPSQNVIITKCFEILRSLLTLNKMIRHILTDGIYVS